MGKFEDFTGRKFGKWTVIKELGRGKVLCQCSCENKTIREVYKKSLKEGKTLSCGCNAVQARNEKNFKDRTGQTYNNWTIIKELGHGRVIARCSCGKEKEMQKALIVNGYSKSCGHDKQIRDEYGNSISYEDRWVGKKFGHWTVISVDTSDHNKVLCRCDCYKKTIREVYKSHLKYGTSTSCGCQEKIKTQLYELDGQYIDMNTYNDILGKQFGNWKVLKIIGRDNDNRTFKVLCECQCSKHTQKELDIHVLLSGRSRSCGCMTVDIRKNTLFNKYGDTVPAKAKDPREEWQIQAVSSADNLEKYILTNFNEYKPSIVELAMQLSVHPSSMWNIVKRYNKSELIQQNLSTSYNEDAIANYIIRNSNYKVKKNDRNAIYPRELDIYIPEKHIAIEYNGDYWHNVQNKGTTYHRDKAIECLNKDIRLIHIYEHEYYDEKYTNKYYRLFKGVCDKYTELCGYNIELNCNIDKFVENNSMHNIQSGQYNLALKIDNEILGAIVFNKKDSNRSIEITGIISKLDSSNNAIKLIIEKIQSIPDINKIYALVNLDLDNTLELKQLGFTIAQLINIKPIYLDSKNNKTESKNNDYSNCIYNSGEAIMIWNK